MCVSRRYINVCNCDMFSVVDVYLDHLKFCVLMVICMSAVVNGMLSLMSVMSPTPALCNLSARTVMKLCTMGVGGVCDMCLCLALGSMDGEDWVWTLPILWEQAECWTCV